MTDAPEILAEIEGGVALVTLNRPAALNALTLGMVRALDPLLAGYAADPDVRAVAVRGAGDRGFCAGGDVRALYEGKARGEPITADFFREEYRLNRRIFTFPKPYVALMDGIVMGGGVGVSVHGSHRVVCEATAFAMPETGIGLFPDVGGSYFLPRLPGGIGMFLAMTGARLKAADCVHAGLGDAFVPLARHGDLLARLRAGQGADAAIAALSADPGPAPLATHRAALDRCFAAESVEAILAALDAEGTDWAAQQAAAMRAKSPTSLKIAFRQLRLGRDLSFDDCLTMEYRLSQRVMAGHDFFEGVRAVVIDKDNAPRWRPARLDDVTAAEIDACFAPLGAADLRFDGL